MTSTRKKIFFLITKGNFGGAQRYVYEIVSSLNRNQFDITVILGEGDTLERKLQALGVKTIKIPSLQRNFYWWTDLKIFLRIWQLLRKEKPQIIHLNSSKIAGLGALAGRLAGIPKIIYTIHGFAFNEVRPNWQKFLIKLLSWLTIFLSHQSIAVADYLKRQTTTWPGIRNKITTIHNGVPNIKFFEKSVARRKIIPGKNDGVWIGVVAELHHNKGLDYLIDAFALTVRALLGSSLGWSISLVIIGQGEELDKLKRLARARRLDNRIYFPGRVEDVRSYLKAFDIFVLTSRTEALPYVILEAGATGLPVIASEVGGISEVITGPEFGILVPQGNIEEIKKSLVFMLKKPKYCELVGKNLRQHILKNFSLKQMIEKTTSLYHQ